MNPEYQRLFPEFKDLTYEELQKAQIIHGHAKRVMKALENAITALDDSVSFSGYLEELGRRHKARSLKPYLLDVSMSSIVVGLPSVHQRTFTLYTLRFLNTTQLNVMTVMSFTDNRSTMMSAIPNNDDDVNNDDVDDINSYDNTAIHIILRNRYKHVIIMIPGNASCFDGKFKGCTSKRMDRRDSHSLE